MGPCTDIESATLCTDIEPVVLYTEHRWTTREDYGPFSPNGGRSGVTMDVPPAGTACNTGGPAASRQYFYIPEGANGWYGRI